MRTVNDDAVHKTIEDASSSHPRFSQWWEALLWRIERRPESGVAGANGSYVYKQKRVKPNDPDIVVVYEFDNHSVTIHAMRLVS